jgi:GNAT superfamily N-acetyltransferase
VPSRRPDYRTAGLLAALVLVGWAADAALGGGAAHGAAWLLALLLVGGIPTLATWSARRRPSETGQPDEQAQVEPIPDRVVRPARPDELAELIEIERAADQLFPLAGYGPTPPPATLAELRDAAGLLVSGDPPAGYARVEVVDGRAHLAGLSVRPRFMRQGRGSELVLAACAWAAAHGYSEMTLCTFAEVPWNGPFYARLGFVELAELTPGLLALREAEGALDAMGRRIVLIRRTAELPETVYLPDS